MRNGHTNNLCSLASSLCFILAIVASQGCILTSRVYNRTRPVIHAQGTLDFPDPASYSFAIGDPGAVALNIQGIPQFKPAGLSLADASVEQLPNGVLRLQDCFQFEGRRRILQSTKCTGANHTVLKLPPAPPSFQLESVGISFKLPFPTDEVLLDSANVPSVPDEVRVDKSTRFFYARYESKALVLKPERCAPAVCYIAAGYIAIVAPEFQNARPANLDQSRPLLAIKTGTSVHQFLLPKGFAPRTYMFTLSHATVTILKENPDHNPAFYLLLPFAAIADVLLAPFNLTDRCIGTVYGPE